MRMVSESRGGDETERAAMARVAGVFGIGTPENVRELVRRGVVDAGWRPDVSRSTVCRSPRRCTTST